MTDGEFARGNNEVFVSEDYREDLEKTLGRHLDVGDTIDVAFWHAGPDSEGVPPDTVVTRRRPRAPAHRRLRSTPGRSAPRELYERQRLVVSPDVARRYQCVGICART